MYKFQLHISEILHQETLKEIISNPPLTLSLKVFFLCGLYKKCVPYKQILPNLPCLDFPHNSTEKRITLMGK